jgi:hypothetical protein
VEVSAGQRLRRACGVETEHPPARLARVMARAAALEICILRVSV